MTKIVGRNGLLALVLALLLFTSQGVAQDKPLKKIYWGVSTLSPTLWIPWIAKEAKLFEKNGLDVEAVLLNGSGRTSQAMLSGSLFAASVALPQVMLADLTGADLVNVAHGIGVQASRLMVRPEIRKVEDLKGKRIGISSLGSAGDLLFGYVLRKYGIDTTRDIIWLAVGNTAERLQALITGTVDAADMTYPADVEAERKGFRYFLEVFDPNGPTGIPSEKLGEFINDNIIRALAGVPEAGRPLFLKIVYHGPRAMEELAQYDPNLVVGILGGSAGTTYDAFKLIHEAQKYGARVALFGRKINNAEHQLAFIEMLRLITEGKISPEEAVRAYHGVLQGKNIKPKLSLEKDLELTDQSMSYDGGAAARSRMVVRHKPVYDSVPRSANHGPANKSGGSSDAAWPTHSNGAPDFETMNAAQRQAYHQARLTKKFR